MPLNRAVQGSRGAKNAKLLQLLERGRLSRDPDGFGQPRHWILESTWSIAPEPTGFYEQLQKTVGR